MRLVLVGPPGAGKGTQAAYITSCYGIVHISTGAMLREQIRAHTPVGEEANRYMAGGRLVPDQLIVEMVRERLAQEDASRGFVLDGFPRSEPQAEALEVYLDQRARPLNSVLMLALADDEIVRRLSQRRTCPVCGRSYHPLKNPPKQPNFCNEEGAPLEQREDDGEAAIRTRLEEYHRQTEPVLGFYRKRGLLVTVDAAQEIGQVQKEIARLLEGCAA